MREMVDLTGKKVKIRWKRYFAEQRIWVFIGQILRMDPNWLEIFGKGYVLAKGSVKPKVDETSRTIVVPREAIAHIRLLPDELNLARLEYEVRDSRIMVKVPGEADTAISEA